MTLQEMRNLWLVYKPLVQAICDKGADANMFMDQVGLIIFDPTFSETVFSSASVVDPFAAIQAQLLVDKLTLIEIAADALNTDALN